MTSQSWIEVFERAGLVRKERASVLPWQCSRCKKIQPAGYPNWAYVIVSSDFVQLMCEGCLTVLLLEVVEIAYKKKGGTR